MKTIIAAASLVLGGLIAQGASAATFSGRITGDDGKPIPGAMVSLSDDKSGITESVYSDATGAFRITTALSGDLGMRIRKFYFADLERPLSLAADSAAKGDFTLIKLKSAEAISDQMPAAYHWSELPFEPGTPFARDKFQNDCLTCHQLGNSFTRWPRSMDDWVAISRRMSGNIGNFDEAMIKKRAEIFAAGFNGKPISMRPDFPYDRALARAKIVTYRLDKAQGPHDAAVDPDNGLIYMVDGKAELMEVTDPKTGMTDYIPAPHDGMNLGGKFARVGMKVGGNSYRGLHSLAYAKDGLWYVTESIASEIGVFNPKTRSWEKSYEIPGKTLYPHTIRVAKDGMVWFTIIATNQMGRLDPVTGQVTVIELPATPSNYLSATKGPYGLDIDPKDGSVWYFKLFNDRIGRVDAKTFEVKEWPSPVEGPRRGQFDSSGQLWITGYSKGQIARIEPNGAKDFKAEAITIPAFAKDVYAAPYSLGVNPKTGDIWVSEGMTDHADRYIPGEKRWISYPMPLMGTFPRDVTFTKEGYACESTNPSPLAALEGGVAQLICIHPDGDIKVEARAN